MMEAENILDSIDPGKVISLDAEFARGKYMLELSMVDGSGRTVYSRRFKPTAVRTWMLEPHNISPAMVKDAPKFRQCLGEIRKIIDGADYMLGFDVGNDLKVMAAENLYLPEDKKIIELRDWFWLLHGKDHGLDLTQGIGNELVAQTLGIEVDSEKVHGSAYDARLTLESFRKLLAGNALSEASDFDELYALTKTRLNEEIEDYHREHSRGYVYIVKKENAYDVKTRVERPEESGDIVAMIEVANRKLAMFELSKRFKVEPTKGNFRIKGLSAANLDYFRNYRNEYRKEDRQQLPRLVELARQFWKA